MTTKKLVLVGAAALATAMFLTGCTADGGLKNPLSSGEADLDGVYNDSAYKQATTSEEGVDGGLLPAWVPAGGDHIQLQQRSTGHERIFIMNYAGSLPDACKSIGTQGSATEKELATAYKSDQRTADMDPAEIVDFRTLEADWWPDNAEDRTTDLCGRWWVHQGGGKLYAFAPDVEGVASKVMEERSME